MNDEHNYCGGESVGNEKDQSKFSDDAMQENVVKMQEEFARLAKEAMKKYPKKDNPDE